MKPYAIVDKGKFIGNEILDFVKRLVFEFVDKGCQKSAAALTYMTLFALVPMMTVTYSMFSIIPAFDGVAGQLNSLIFDNFVPETGDQLKGYLADFSTQARNLTGFGVVFLFVTAYLMLKNIEQTFNVIWGVKDARKGLSSFLLYWAVLSIGPFLLGAGIVISSTYLIKFKLTVQEYDPVGAIHVFVRVVPLLMTSLALTLLFAAVPNCRVPLRIAATGGFVTAVCFELLKIAFGKIVANSSFKLIYGAFAIVPLFLMWINFLWITVLVGAVFVRTLSEQGYGTRNVRSSDIRAVLQCLAMFRAKAQTGDKAMDKDCLATGLSLVHWQSLRSLLVRNKWIVVTETGGYTLCRDLNSVTIWDVACLVNMPVNEPIPDRSIATIDKESTEWLNDYFRRREQVEEYTKNSFELSLEELFSER